jgi:hypothetical protein
MHLLDESNFETFDTCLRISCQNMTLLSTHQEIFSEILEVSPPIFPLWVGILNVMLYRCCFGVVLIRPAQKSFPP